MDEIIYEIKDDGIYKSMPWTDKQGNELGCLYEKVISKEAFIEAYKKWITQEVNND